MQEQERNLLESINQILKKPGVASQIDEIADRVERNFDAGRDFLAWETVPLQIYDNQLPERIRSSWVFLLKEGSASGAERHPNSHQRVRSWRRAGDFQIWKNDHWESNFLKNGYEASIEEQWASIPSNVWHQAVVGPGEPWIVVSFHTAGEQDLIEERPNPNDERLMQQRTYLPRLS